METSPLMRIEHALPLNPVPGLIPASWVVITDVSLDPSVAGPGSSELGQPNKAGGGYCREASGRLSGE